MGNIRVKFCGLRTPQEIAAAEAVGARYIGFNFFEKSPRYVDFEKAAELALTVPLGLQKVGLLVDPDDATLEELRARVPLDMIQLHGSETPERVAAIRTLTGMPVMKAVGVSTEEDLGVLDDYAKVADQLLIDAKPPKGSDLPGGNGETFDWSLLEGRSWPVPWMLAGGLRPSNVAEAVAATGAVQVDVSSGVESAPGEKDPQRMAAFMEALS